MKPITIEIEGLDKQSNAVRLCYAFMLCNRTLYAPEAAIINSHANDFDEESIVPKDQYAAQFGQMENSLPLPSYDEFEDLYYEHLSGMICVAALDQENDFGITLMLYPEDIAKEMNPDGRRIACNNVFDAPDEMVEPFLEELKEKYNSLLS